MSHHKLPCLIHDNVMEISVLKVKSWKTTEKRKFFLFSPTHCQEKFKMNFMWITKFSHGFFAYWRKFLMILPKKFHNKIIALKVWENRVTRRGKESQEEVPRLGFKINGTWCSFKNMVPGLNGWNCVWSWENPRVCWNTLIFRLFFFLLLPRLICFEISRWFFKKGSLLSLVLYSIIHVIHYNGKINLSVYRIFLSPVICQLWLRTAEFSNNISL